MSGNKNKNLKSIIECVVLSFVIAYGVHYLGYFLRVRFFLYTDSLGLSDAASHLFIYLGHIIFLVCWLVYAWAVRKDRKYIMSFLPRRGSKSLLWLLGGAVTGLLMMGICICAASINGDITVQFRNNNENYRIIGLGLLAVLLQASTEEIESRGFLFGKMKAEGVPVSVAVLVSAFFFGYLHMANPGFGLIPMLSIVTVGCFYALSYHYFGNLWFCCGAHTLWNYSQDFIFGLPDSGRPAVASIMDTLVNGGGFFYDTEFGIEGSLMAISLNIFSCIVVILIGKKIKN